MIHKIIDKDGFIYNLYESTIQHIRTDHCIESPIELVRDIIQNPDIIVESNWEKHTFLYYKKMTKGYKVVVASKLSLKIKTAYFERKLKQGKILWINPKIKG